MVRAARARRHAERGNHPHARQVARILQTEELRARIDSLGGEPVGNTPQEFGAIIRADIAKWRRLVDQAGIKAD
jgi:tripartite-type tricarboxylate transporter receptor subunit TctC